MQRSLGYRALMYVFRVTISTRESENNFGLLFKYTCDTEEMGSKEAGIGTIA